MAFKTFKPKREPVTLTELGTRIARRAEALAQETGAVEVPRNSGGNRTASKRALLKAIEGLGGKW